MQQITYITVDVGRVDSLPPIVPAKQGDTGRYVQATVTDKGVPFTPSGAIAVARIRKPDGTACVYDEGISISGGVVMFPLVDQALTAAGRARGEISLYTSAADRITTFDFWLDIEKNAVSDGEIVSTDYYNALTALAAQILASSTMVKPLGYYATLTALKAGVPNPNPGDMYGVGTAAPYNYYTWDAVNKEWRDSGQIEGAPGADGPAGATFTPIVYSDGVLAWTNDAGLDNPDPVNITGPMGPPGTGLKILGYYATLEALMTDVPIPAAGDTYGVGLAAPYDIYVWDGVGQVWVNNRQLEGAPGATFTPSVSESGTLSWTNDGGLENPAPVNIKGADGTPGATGPTGPAGPNRITADTDTDLNGVLVGEEGNVTAYTADAAREYIGAASNPDLLDNSDFRNPVNQRGVSGTISTTGYFIDRWILVSGTVTIGSTGLTLNGTIKQIREFAVGRVTTASVKVLSGEATAAYDDSTKTFTITSNGGVVERAKLETGLISTIENDPPMDYAIKLAKCQYYFERIQGEGNAAKMQLGFSGTSTAALDCGVEFVTKRIKPSFSISSQDAFLVTKSSYTKGLSSTKVEASYISKNRLALAVYASLEVGSVYRTYIKKDAYIDLSADL